jgi:hypothetical protein
MSIVLGRELLESRVLAGHEGRREHAGGPGDDVEHVVTLLERLAPEFPTGANGDMRWKRTRRPR